MKIKRYLSILLCILLTLPFGITPVFAGVSAGEFVINGLGDAVSGTSQDTEITLDGSPTAKWLTKGSGSQVVYNINDDISEYDTLNVQLYSPKVTDDTIGLHIYTTNGYATRIILVDWEGWKTVRVPMSTYAKANLKEATTFQLWDHGWSYTYGDAISGSDKNGSMNIGRIWLSVTGEYVIRDGDITPSRGTNCSVDREFTYEGEATLKWLTKGNNDSQVVYNLAGDFTGYQTLNMQIYSPKSTNNTIGIHFYTAKSYSAKALPVNWEGWKTVQIPMSDFSSVNLSEAESFQLWDHGWNYTYGDAVSGSDKNGILYVAKIWIDNSEIQKPEEPEIPDTPVTPDVPEDDGDEYVIREDIITPSRGNTCSLDNSLKYDGLTTLKWTTTGNESQIVYNIAGDVSGYQTFNMQLYSPKATNDTIGIHFHSSKGYATKTVTVDWEGWKTIQIPMSDYSSITLSEIATFQMWDHGWSYTFGDAVSGSDKAGSLNIGKIWLDNSEIETPGEPDTPPSEPDEPVVPDEPEDEETEGEYIVAKYDSNFSFGGKLSKDTENVYEQDASAKWDVRTGNNFGYNVLDCDFNDYTFVYATVYSPKSTGSVIMFQYLYDGTGYATSAIPLNFEGWKTLAFPISELNIGSNKVKSFNVYNNGWNNKIEGIEYVNFERIWLSKYDINSCEVISSSLTDGYNRVSPVDFSITLGTTSKLAPDVLPEIVLMDESGNEIACDVKISGNKLTVCATETLLYSESYSLKISGITNKNGYSGSFETSFKTHNFDVTASTPVLSESNGKIMASTDAVNPTEEEKEVVLWLMEYSSDGKLVNKDVQKVLFPGEESKEITAEITLSSSDTIIEAFVTDASGRPVVPFVAALGKDENEIAISCGGDGELKLGNIAVLPSGIDAEAILKSKFIAPVAAIIRNEKGEDVYAKAVMTDADGKASFKIKLSSDELASGKYTLVLCCEQSADAPEYEFYFANSEDKKSAFDAINLAVKVSEKAELIEENREMFNISKEVIENNQTAKFLAEVFIENEASDFDELSMLADIALKLRDEINSCDWNKLPEIIEENYDILLCSELKSEFSDLGGEKKAKVSKKLKENCPYELFSDFASDLEDAIEDVKSEKDKKPSSGGGGGGGGGGSSYSVPLAPVTDDVTSDEKENGLPFNDLASASWATQSIVSLYNQGIISASQNGNFRPNDNITREEFAKLICLAFGFEDALAECEFSDVSKDAWYYSYVASLCSKGIITGYGESFGTGDLITREDMAVMALRALNAKGESLSFESVKFSDDGVISDYAKTAVYSLKNAGIINGMGDGSFAPKFNSTRAQAAKIISGLIGLIN